MRLLHETTTLCRVCKDALPGRVVADDAGEVWLEKACPAHGPQRARLSADAAWYQRTRQVAPRPSPPRIERRPVERGCPFDCGPCEQHQQRVRLPVVTITSRCDLDCPICYVHNNNVTPYDMTLDEFDRVLEALTRDHGGVLDVVNLTGGEPTLHPLLPEFVARAQAAGIHRVSVCSHGIRLVKDPDLLRRLADLGARIALSFDSFEEGADAALNGAKLVDLKLRCLDALAQHGVDATLIPVMTRGVNDHEIGRIIELGLGHPSVRHLEVHTVTYTGQSGVRFDRSGRISMDQVLDRIAETTGGVLGRDDFVPSPCAHPLCYQIAYLLLDPAGGPPVSFSRFLAPGELYACLADRLYLEPSPRLERALQDAINRLWTQDDPESQRALGLLNHLLRAVFPTRPLSRADALRASEQLTKAVYVHSHMDEETFDVERAIQCCDSNCYPSGATIPVCNSNVLYRETNPRFNPTPRPWGARAGGWRGRPLPVAAEGP